MSTLEFTALVSAAALHAGNMCPSDTVITGLLAMLCGIGSTATPAGPLTALLNQFSSTAHPREAHSLTTANASAGGAGAPLSALDAVVMPSVSPTIRPLPAPPLPSFVLSKRGQFNSSGGSVNSGGTPTPLPDQFSPAASALSSDDMVLTLEESKVLQFKGNMAKTRTDLLGSLFPVTAGDLVLHDGESRLFCFRVLSVY